MPNLVQDYKHCLSTRKFDEAKRNNKEINYFIANMINTTGYELWRFADDLMMNAGRFEESIPIYFAAASLYKKERDLREMSWCVGGGYEDDGKRDGSRVWKGMHGANVKMIERDGTMKEVVKHHVIPLMHNVKEQMLELTSVSDKDKYWWVSWVLEYIALSEELLDDDKAAEETMKECEAWKERYRIEKKRCKPWWKKIKDVL